MFSLLLLHWWLTYLSTHIYSHCACLWHFCCWFLASVLHCNIDKSTVLESCSKEWSDRTMPIIRDWDIDFGSPKVSFFFYPPSLLSHVPDVWIAPELYCLAVWVSGLQIPFSFDHRGPVHSVWLYLYSLVPACMPSVNSMVPMTFLVRILNSDPISYLKLVLVSLSPILCLRPWP